MTAGSESIKFDREWADTACMGSRRLRRLRPGAFAVVGVLVSVAAGTMAGPSDVAEAASVSKLVTVDTVIDGDTFEYRENGSIRRVRVAGLNTNELAQSPKCWVDEATERLRQLVEGQSVTLLANDAGSSAGGREYRHVIRNGINVATTMLSEGLAIPLILRDEPGDVVELLAAADRAAALGLGLWDDDACGAGPAADVEIITNGAYNGDEYVRIRNRAGSALSLSGWTLTDSSLEAYSFPSGVSIPGGGVLTVHVGVGSDTSRDLFMNRSSSVFSDAFDGAFLLDTDNDIRSYDIWPCIGLCEESPSSLVIDAVSADPPGNDDLNPNGEWIRVRNTGASTVDLQDWEIASWPHHLRPEQSVPVGPGSAVTVYVGRGTATATELYMNKERSILDTAGDVVVLVAPGGDVADCFAYGTGSCFATPPKDTVRRGVPDFNGDGWGDVAVGAPGSNGGAGAIDVSLSAGSALMLEGVPNRVVSAGGRYQISQTGPVPGASEPNDGFGTSIAVGDFDDDGRSDLVVGVPGENSSAGALVVIPGSDSGPDAEASSAYSQAGPIDGSPEGGDRFGEALAVGDFDGDGHADLAVGVPGENSSSGLVTVLRGTPSGLTTTGDLTFSQSGPIPGVSEPGDGFGGVLAAGDFDGDGYADLAIGAPGEAIGSRTAAGAVTIVLGSASGLDLAGSYGITQSGPVPGTPEAGDEFGGALAVGDIDGDGDDDLAVGAPGEAIGSRAGAGLVTILYGSAQGVTSRGAQGYHQGFGLTGAAESGDAVGSALLFADVVSGSTGFDDLLIGSPGEDLGSIRDAGLVQILRGTSGPRPGQVQSLTQSGDIPGVNETGDAFGSTLSVADVRGDGFVDLLIGLPGERIGSSGAGVGAVAIVPTAEARPGVSTGLQLSSSVGWTQSSFGASNGSNHRFGDALS